MFNKKQKTIGLLLLAALTFTTFPSTPLAQDQKWVRLVEPEDSIVGIASEAGNFKTLLAAIKAAGLLDTLQGPGPFTVFAPTDQAFGKVDQNILSQLLREENLAQLQSVLKNHVVSGRWSLRDAFYQKGIKNLEGNPLSVLFENARFTVNEKLVLENDLNASNGVIHVIDQVLIPKGLKLAAPIISTPRKLIELAIDRGVPLFNNHQPEACFAIYEVTSQALLCLPEGMLSNKSVSILKKALEAAGGENDASAKAWILRAALDYTFVNLPEEEKKTVSIIKDVKLIDDFSGDQNASALGTKWRLFTDRVMGGVSRATSRYEVLDGKPCIRLKGNVSLENNGGFVQIALPFRADGRSYDATQFKGIRLWVKGNGKPYYLHLRTTQNRLPWQYFDAPIETNGEWSQVEIPFDAFTGQNIRSQLDTSRLLRIGVVGAKKKFDADIAVARMEFYR